MARPSDISTKPVATRIPMPDYLRILKEATDQSMSISDWLLFRIYNDTEDLLKKELEEERAAHNSTRALFADKDGETINLRKELDKLSGSVEQLKAKNKKLEEEGHQDGLKASTREKALQEEKKSLTNEIQGLRKQIEKDNAEIKKINDLLQKWVESHNQWKAVAEAAEKRIKDIVALNGQILSELQFKSDKSFWNDLPAWALKELQKLPTK
jgi:chromosome segregation ATPase